MGWNEAIVMDRYNLDAQSFVYARNTALVTDRYPWQPARLFITDWYRLETKRLVSRTDRL